MDEAGVASTVGTIMALLVFLTFLSLIVNQYVPVWMKDEEAAHMGEALGEFGGFKTNIDLQILAAQTAQQVRRHYVPVTTFSTVKLGVDGVPIFSAPTVGELNIRSGDAPWTVWFEYRVAGVNTPVPEANCGCGGTVRLHVFNRFFVPQSIAYENGALIRAQSDGQIIKADPSFRVLVANGTAQVDFTLVQVFGSGGVAGVGAEGLQAQVIGVDFQEYEAIQTDVFANYTGRYGPAWFHFFNRTLGSAYRVTGANFAADPSNYKFIPFYEGNIAAQLRVDTPFYLVQSLWNSGDQVYHLTLQFKNGGGGVPLSTFRLLHAYANVAAGEQGNVVGI